MVEVEKDAKKGFKINEQDYWAQHVVSFVDTK